MALHPIGSDAELLEIQTPCLMMTIKGTDAASPVLSQNGERAATLKVACDEDFVAQLAGDPEETFAHALSGNFVEEYHHRPLFFEQRRYELIIEALEGHSVSFWHDNYHVRKQLSRVGKNQQLLTGVINFGNDIGNSDLVVMVDGHPYLTVTIEVFPSKIDYQKDYQAIISEVTQEVYNLVFDFLKKTYESFDVAPTRHSSPVEFFAIIQRIYSDFITAADIILRAPHHILNQEAEVLPFHKIRRVNERTMRWMEKHPEQVRRGMEGYSAEKALAVRKDVTYNTNENRLTKLMLEQTVRRLNTFRKQYERMGRGTDSEVLRKLDAMSAGIDRRCHTGFLKEVSAGHSNIGMSLVFGMAQGYRQLYRCFLLLQRGLSVTGSIFHLSVKDLAVLYEYWCFIKLNSLMKDRYELISQDIIKTDGSGLFVALRKGQRSRVRYRDPKTGEIITLSYNPKEEQTPTVTQRPDNVLSLKKRGSSTEYEYVFDAKYRINPAIPGTDYYQNISHTPGPETDDINTMHRYRDAIVYRRNAQPYERKMFGAYVLFPYANEEEYRNHRFFKSIDEVNIGGLPFLPSANRMVTDMLDDLIADSPESAFERATLPRGTEEKLKKVDWSRREVLIGTVRSQEQLQACLDYCFYYVPVTVIDRSRLPIRMIALYLPKDRFGARAGVTYYAEILSMEQVKRNEIIEFPRDSEEAYYRFNLREWRQLDRTIKPREYGIRTITFTNEFLLKHSLYIPELFFRTEEEYRFWTELKRYAGDATMINDDQARGFTFGDYQVIFEDGMIKLAEQGKVLQQVTIQSFQQRPNTVFRGLMQSQVRNQVSAGLGQA